MLKKLFKKSSTPLKHHVEICISNQAYGDPDVFDRLVAREDVDVEEVGCNSYCEICEKQPYVLINHECIEANTEEELYEKIESYIKQFS